jgi:hypothetical protein
MSDVGLEMLSISDIVQELWLNGRVSITCARQNSVFDK